MNHVCKRWSRNLQGLKMQLDQRADAGGAGQDLTPGDGCPNEKGGLYAGAACVFVRRITRNPLKQH